MQRKLTKAQLTEIVNRIEIGPQIFGASRAFNILEKGDGFLIQLMFYARDVTSRRIELQKYRKWYVSTYATNSEVVETCFKAARLALEHELKENFKYRGALVYNPHFDVEARVDLDNEGALDVRK